MTAFAATRTTSWFTADDCRLEDFRAVVETPTDLTDYPYADEVRENVLIYGPRLRNPVATPEGRRDAQADPAPALAPRGRPGAPGGEGPWRGRRAGHRALRRRLPRRRRRRPRHRRLRGDDCG